MDYTLFVFLPAILALGIITSYEDCRSGKIRNRYISFALIYAVIAYLFVIIYLAYTGFEVRFSYLFDLFLNGLLALAFGFLIWNFKFWSAADAKLFFAYSVLVPLSVYSNTYFSYFPSFVILLNTFIPALFFVVFGIIAKTSLKEKMSFVMEIDLKEFPVLLLNLFWLVWLSRIMGGFGINLGQLGGIFIVWGMMFLIYRYAGKNRLSLGIIMSGIRVIFDFSYVITTAFLFEMLYYTILTSGMFLLMVFLMHFSAETRPVPVRSLKAGMIIADIIYKEGKKYKRLPVIRAINMLPRNRLSLDNVGGELTERGVDKLKSLQKSERLDFSEVKIKQTVPFAPFMFLGVLLTIVAEGFFLMLLM